MTTLLRLLLAGATLAVALTGTAAAATTELAVEQRPFTVSSDGTTFVWTHFDVQAGTFGLLTADAHGEGVPTPSPSTSPAPIDADLGSNRNGNPYAVWSRCTGADG